MLIASLLVASIALTPVAPAATDEAYLKDIEAWHAQRSERLKAPGGWLSLVGLDWLKQGANRVGSAKDNDIVLAGAPAHLGTVTWSGDAVTFALADGVDATIDGGSARSATLLDDSNEKPTTIAFGTTSFYLIDRSGQKALRVKDTAAATRTGFLGLEHFPIDASWRIEAEWVAFDPPRTLEIPNITGQVEHMKVPGKAVFERDGKRFELLPVVESDQAKQLFFILADRTSSKQTYGAGRFLYSDFAKDGKVVLDFNKAYNPPCAFTPYATCPLAPPENRLAIAVEAGELKYRGAAH